MVEGKVFSALGIMLVQHVHAKYPVLGPLCVGAVRK